MLDRDPREAVRQARQIEVTSSDPLKAMFVRAAILVDGGGAIQDRKAIEEGLALYREVYKHSQTANVTYNLANALVGTVGFPPNDGGWLDHQERTRKERAEARRLYWQVAEGKDVQSDLRTQAWTNLGNQLSHSFRLAEAHDALLAALDIDPTNGVAAGSAARDLLWLFDYGNGSDLTRQEAGLMAKIASDNKERTRELAGEGAAETLAGVAAKLGATPTRSEHNDPFIQWVERERLTLAPAVELVDPELGKIDWLMLPGILQSVGESGAGMPPPIYAMFNTLKAEFILARDLIWRTSQAADWPSTGRFADTLDFAKYGPDASAVVLAQRSALDILDKVGVTANYYFELGLDASSLHFDRMWRVKRSKKGVPRAVSPRTKEVIEGGVRALYGLVELADDYFSEKGILRSQKDLRNTGTHRFIVLHDICEPADCRHAEGIEHQSYNSFYCESLRALRVARSAIQMLVFAIAQNERKLRSKVQGPIGTIGVPDHDDIRGRNGADELGAG